MDGIVSKKIVLFAVDSFGNYHHFKGILPANLRLAPRKRAAMSAQQFRLRARNVLRPTGY